MEQSVVRCNDLGKTASISEKTAVEFPRTSSNRCNERPGTSLMLSRILCELETKNLKDWYEMAYSIMRRKHDTRSPTISLIYELGFDGNKTSIEDRRSLRRYLLDNGVQLRGPDKQGFDPKTTQLKSRAQRRIRKNEGSKKSKIRVEKMRQARWVDKSSHELERIQNRQKASLSETLKKRTPSEWDAINLRSYIAFLKALPTINRKRAVNRWKRTYWAKSQSDRQEIQRKRNATKKVVTAIDGKTLRVNSLWELGMYNTLRTFGVHFHYNSDDVSINLGRVTWYPDFVLSDLGWIIEVKGHPRALKRWEEIILPAIKKSPLLANTCIFVADFNVGQRQYVDLHALLSDLKVVHGVYEIVCTSRRREDRGRKSSTPIKSVSRRKPKVTELRSGQQTRDRSGGQPRELARCATDHRRLPLRDLEGLGRRGSLLPRGAPDPRWDHAAQGVDDSEHRQVQPGQAGAWLVSELISMDQLKLGELLEHPESRSNHCVAGNGKRDGLKIDRIGQSAAEPPVGNVQVEGSTTRPMSPNNNSAHEYPAPSRTILGGDDIVCSAVRAAEVGIKSPAITTKHGADRGHEHRQQPSPHPWSAHLISVGKD